MWIMFIHSFSSEPSNVLKQAIEGRYTVQSYRQFDLIDLYLVSPKRP